MGCIFGYIIYSFLLIIIPILLHKMVVKKQHESENETFNITWCSGDSQPADEHTKISDNLNIADYAAHMECYDIQYKKDTVKIQQYPEYIKNQVISCSNLWNKRIISGDAREDLYKLYNIILSGSNFIYYKDNDNVHIVFDNNEYGHIQLSPEPNCINVFVHSNNVRYVLPYNIKNDIQYLCKELYEWLQLINTAIK